jgi:photosystem II stability/assembly factor-like uncharacterized protein
MLFAGGQGAAADSYGSVASASLNAGQGWTRRRMAYPCRGYCKALTAHTGAVQAVYTGGWVCFPTGTYGVVFKSTDFGATWESLPGSLPDTVFGVMADDEGGPGVFCAAQSGVYRSTDEGENWERVLTQRGMRAVTRYGQTCAAAGDSGAWLSTDRGGTWVKLDSVRGTTKVSCLEFMSGRDDWLMLLAGTQGQAVHYWDFGPTGVAEKQAQPADFKAVASVYRTRLQLELSRPMLVRLRDVSGRVVLRASLPRGRAELDVSGLAAGPYFLHGASDSEPEWSGKKVIIQP